MSQPDTFSRNLTILRRHINGDLHTDIARDYGVTRERIRQVVAKFGAKPRHEMTRENHARVLLAIKADNLTADEAADRFGIHKSVAYKIGHDAGHVFRKDLLSNSADVAAMAERVRAGESIYAVANGDHAIQARLWGYCQKHGISSSHGRWRSFDVRRETIRRCRAEGMTWDQVTAALAKVEPRGVIVQAVYAWARKNMDPSDVSPKAALRMRNPKAAKPRKTVVPRILPDVVLASSAKEAARLNYGKAPASLIAAAHGVTRNSIIGHWFRLRRLGVLTDVSSAHKYSEVQ